MKTNKRGISLIVLVITIIVIIILAAAVILTLNNNNPIANSKQATFDSDVAEVTSALNIYISNFIAKNPIHDGPFDTSGAEDDSWIQVGFSGTDAQYGSETAGQTYAKGVTWSALGIKQPSTIAEIQFNAKNGKVRAVPTQGGVNGTLITPATDDTPAVYYKVGNSLPDITTDEP